MMLLIALRLLAFLAATILLSAAGVGLLLWDARTYGLYGWDSIHLGYSLLVGAAVVGATLGREHLLLRMLGLRLVLSNGMPAPRLHRASRSLLFWLFVLAPSVFKLSDILSDLPISYREQIIAGTAADLALICLPAVTVLLSRGISSIHDGLIGTRVVRRGEMPLSSVEGKTLFSPLRLAVAGYSFVFACFILLAVFLDWRYRIADLYGAYFRARAPYMESVIKSVKANAANAMDLISQAPPSELYVNEDFTAYLPGQTERFRLRVSPAVLADPLERLRAAINGMAMLVGTITPTTEWVAIRLFSDRAVGPFTLEQGYEFLIERHTWKIRYAPTKQRHVFGKRSLTLEERLEQKVWPDSVITTFEPKLSQILGVRSGAWKFPSLDFTAPAEGPHSRFIGPGLHSKPKVRRAAG
jgi:hypothetical protein